VNLLSDTSDEARQLLIEHWRRVSPEEKAAHIGRLNRMVMSLAAARQDQQYPDATPEERRLRLASLWIDRDSMIKFWGWDPEIHGR
jgi:hypothetical protein